MKIHTQCLVMILMVIHNIGGQTVTTPGEKVIDELTSKLELTQLINEPRKFEHNKNPSIDLIFTDQPNLVMESGVRQSLDSYCHYQITHCRMNYKLAPPINRKIWDYNKANVPHIRRSISKFPWHQH